MSMRHTPWVLGAALLLASASLAAQASDADQPDNPEVVKLTIRGVKVVEKGELQQSIATDESHCRGLILTPFCWISKSPAIYQHNYLDRTELRRDVLRIRVFYWKRGYRETTVDTVITRKAGGVAVTFNVTEGPPTLVRKIAVGPETPVLSAKDIRTSMVLKAGKPLNLLQLDSSLLNLSDKLWERGYADAVVKTDTLVVDDSSHWADVSVLVEPRWKATIGEIRIAGNEQVSERTIRNSLAMHEGELYRRSEVVESQRNLYESQLFRHAAIVVPPQGDSVKLIEVTVREAPLRDARISTGFNTVEFVQLEGRFRHYNFLGGARQLDLTGAIGNLLAPQLNARWPFRNAFTAVQPGDLAAFERPTWQASADIRQPWFQNSRNTIGLGVFAHRRAQPPVYIDRGEGASATFTREVAVRAPASATYRFEFTRIEAGDLYFCVYYGVCDSPTIQAQRKPQRLSPFSLTAQIDRTNEAFSPTKGILGRFELEHAARYTGSDYGYARTDADLAIYRRMGGERNVLALHARAGIVRPIGADALHPRKRFYAGGSQSVRGYGENQLGPRALTIPASKLVTIYGCNVAEITICDPNGVVAKPDLKNGGVVADTSHLKARDFTPRPLGGTSLVEGSVEYRFPVWRQLGGAAFVDAGIVGNAGLRNLGSGNGAVTPGLGVRYRSPVGPIRVDIAFNPSIAEELPVYTERPTANGRPELVPLDKPFRYQPATSFLDRLTFHFSIGEAF